MSRVYTASFNGIPVTLQQDFFDVTAASGKNLRILAVCLSQETDYKDAEEEGLRIIFRAGNTTPSNGTSVTVVRNNVTDAAAGFTVLRNGTTKASGGTAVNHHIDVWNIRMPFWWIPTERMQVELTGGRRFCVELAKTPADSITMSGTIYVEEFG